MFVVLLKFSGNKSQAGQFMEGHKEWIKRGFDDAYFCWSATFSRTRAVGSWRTIRLCPSFKADDDPFVAEDVVSAEILEITPSGADERLKFISG